MTDPTFNLAQLAQRPNWYDHIGTVEAARKLHEVHKHLEAHLMHLGE